MGRGVVSMRSQRGFNLIELMVAITIGLFILGGVVVVMSNSRKNYEVQDYMARLQENARFAVQFLSYDLRMAGYMGCANALANASVDVPGAPVLERMTATDGGGTGGPPDIVTVRYADPSATVTLLTSLENTDGSEAQTVTVSSIPAGWAIGDYVSIADCSSASVAQITAIEDDDVTVTADLQRNFTAGSQPVAQMRRLTVNQYTIGTTADGAPVLLRNGTELVPGVENLQLLYGSSAGYATTPANPDAVAGVRFGMLVRSVSSYRPELDQEGEFGTTDAPNIATAPSGYPVLNATVTAPDIRGQRRVFESSAMVRNNLL